MNHQLARPTMFFGCTLFVLALFTPNSRSFAQGVSTPLFTNHVVVPGPLVEIGNAANPIPVDLDPLGPPWNKSVGDPNNIVMGLSNVDFIETLVNVGTEPWTDWHEVFLAPPVGLIPPVWTNVFGLSVNSAPITFTATGLGTGTLDLFNFSQPVLPGNVFRIHKRGLIDGSLISAGFLRLQEYPTTVPEPANLAFFALLGFAAFQTRRTRTRSASEK